MLVKSEKEELSNTIRDFKIYASKVILHAIQETNESRRAWMLRQFKSATFRHKRNDQYQFWSHDISNYLNSIWLFFMIRLAYTTTDLHFTLYVYLLGMCDHLRGYSE